MVYDETLLKSEASAKFAAIEDARPQTLNDVIARCECKANNLRGLALELNAKLFTGPADKVESPAPSNAGMLGDLERLERILAEACDVLSVVNERLS
jgi:hypothetical protein